MRVEELWRYPVKSLRGERLRQADVRLEGVVGDRLVHVRERRGRVVTSRYRPGLLGLAASLGPDGDPLIEGRPWNDPESLAGRPGGDEAGRRARPLRVADHGQRFDVLPLTVLTDGAAAAVAVDHRRFRPNIVIGGVPGLTEREWVGRALRSAPS